MNKVGEFQRAVRKHFDFLTAHDFSRPEERIDGDACWITYRSPRVSVMLCYGPPQFEASLSFWLNVAPKMSLGVGDLTVVGQKPEAWKAAPRTGGLEHQVSWFASAIRSVESKLCSGDPLFYELLSSARRAALAEWRQSEKLRAMRSRAETAWENKRYGELVKIYRTEEAGLTALERKRLAYAEKKARLAEK